MYTSKISNCMLILISICIVFTGASCSVDKISTNTEITKSNISTSIEATTEKNEWQHEIEKEDMGGYEFRMLIPEPFLNDMYRENEMGEVLNDAIYQKNAIISDYFNIKIITTVTNDDTLANKLLTASVRAGDDAYDISLSHISKAYPNSVNNYYYNLLDIKALNMKAPWWSPNAAESLTIDNKLYVGTGAYSISNLSQGMILVFNKDLSKSFGLPEPYELVKNGEWTIDKLAEITKDVYKDINGNGESDIDDMYGFAIHGGGSKHGLMVSAGQFNALKDDNDTPYFNMSSNKAVNIFNKYFDFFFNSGNSVLYTKDNDPLEKLAPEKFSHGYLMYMNATLTQLEKFKNMSYDYGIIPMPKYDVTQNRYYTLINNWAPCLVIPSTVSDPERTGKIIEAMARENYKTVIPVYADVVLKNKYSRDSETADMVDLIVDSLTSDMGYLFEVSGFSTTTVFDSQQNDWISSIEKVTEKTNIKYAQFAQQIKELT